MQLPVGTVALVSILGNFHGKLSRQVLAALYELLRGFVTAHRNIRSNTMMEMARERPGHLYGGLITALMRLVFILYAEDRGLMPDHPIYERYYSLRGLFSKLRGDDAAWPDTMEQRFGGWAQLLSLFRLIHGGAAHGELEIVARKGTLFDPERFPFLEGHTGDKTEDTQIPRVSDSTVYKVLTNLMTLEGERLSYRTLDVEQIGSVYEAIMGFRIELTRGWSIGVRSQKRTGAAAIVNLEELLKVAPGKRAEALRKAADQKLTGAAAKAFRTAETPMDVIAALDQKIDREATPGKVPPGTPILQPTDERRRSGSHYTPRSLTEPIVSKALDPIFERLGKDARPEEILDLKVLDPASGSGAFLVEACRQLAARLVDAWAMHGGPEHLPSDEDELLHALRLVAQRCLYGVDRNPMAIDLAKLSLWLATLAKDQEFTFIDHTLRYGDSLLGLSRRQIEGLDWAADKSGYQVKVGAEGLRNQIGKATELHQLMREASADIPEHELHDVHAEARAATEYARRLGDLTLAAYFKGTSQKERKALLAKLTEVTERGEAAHFDSWLGDVNGDEHPFRPFHWDVEFPEVFERENPGFDAVVGNPPFGGHVTAVSGNIAGYTDWLRLVHPGSSGKCDIVAHFFRRAFELIRSEGTFGLIATNTIAQGDTRSTGLRWICNNGGEIYRARRRLKWPGLAAVVVSVLHLHKGRFTGQKQLDDETVDKISAFLFHRGGHDDPEPLKANEDRSFQGSIILGMGFTFDDTDKKGVATSLSEMKRLLATEPRNREVVFPYIGGEEVNSSPTHTHHRFAIHFRDYPLQRENIGHTWADANEEQRREWLRQGIVPLDYRSPVAADWPELLDIVEERVKPERMVSAQKSKSSHGRRAAIWWQHYHQARDLYATIGALNRVIINSQVSAHLQFAFSPADMIFAHTTYVFPFETYAAFCTLQSRPHETWARAFASSLEDRLRYTPSDCFETFPFPEDWENQPDLETSGIAYYEYRAKLMTEHNEGLTKIYNRFHDPADEDSRIRKLRALHEAMDQAVLATYNWNGLPELKCEFIPDYEDDDESGKKKRTWRYRWPDDVRDEILMRLLTLNKERAEEERLTGKRTRATTGKRKSG